MVVKMMLKKYLPKILLSWMGFFFIALGLYFFVLLPQSGEKKRLDDEYRTLSAQYQQAQSFIGESNKTKLGLEVAELTDKAGLFIFEPTNASNLTLDISGLYQKLNLPLKSFSIGKHEERPIQNCTQIAESPLRVSFKSSFNQFFSLLNELERYKPVVFIDTFKISKPQQELESNEVVIDVAVFVSKLSPTSNKNKLKDGI